MNPSPLEGLPSAADAIVGDLIVINTLIMAVTSNVTNRSVGVTNGFDLRGGNLEVSDGAVLEGGGVSRGFNITGRNTENNSIVMSSGLLTGRSTGTTSSSLYGVYCSGGISVSGGRIEGYGQLGTTALSGSVGVSYDQSHGGYPLTMTDGEVKDYL